MLPTGNVSTTTYGPTALSGPLLVTLTFHLNCVPGMTLSSSCSGGVYSVTWVFVSARSADAITVCAVTFGEVTGSQPSVGLPGFQVVLAVLMCGIVVPTPGFVTTSLPGMAWNVTVIFLFTGRSVPVFQASFTASGLVVSSVGSVVEIRHHRA